MPTFNRCGRMLYAAKCYWPGITPTEFERTAVLQLAELQSGGDDRTAQYLGSILFAADELALCLFESSSSSNVRRATEQAHVPAERIMDSIWYPACAPQDHERVPQQHLPPLRRSA
jgi:hypothetical protein